MESEASSAAILDIAVEILLMTQVGPLKSGQRLTLARERVCIGLSISIPSARCCLASNLLMSLRVIAGGVADGRHALKRM